MLAHDFYVSKLKGIAETETNENTNTNEIDQMQ